MKAVNLASKPFVNRRPVLRVAALVWVLGLALLVVNLWRYGDFFRAASGHRSRLADLENEIGIEEEQDASLRRRIEALKLDEDNDKARYLNQLIHQRIFPWSRLFDEIEDVLPKDVYLTGLSPEIEKVELRKKSSSKTSNRNRTSGKNSQQQPRKDAPKVAEKDLDRVELELAGYARTDEAMLQLIDNLYASPTFLDPELSYERRDKRTALVSFSIKVTYLTRVRSQAAAGEAVAAGNEADAAAAAGAGGSGELVAGGAGSEGQLYGQPGFTPPAGSPATRPGFGPAGTPNSSPNGAFDTNLGGGGNVAGGGPASGNRVGAGAAGRAQGGPFNSQNVGGQNGQPTFVQPGFAQPGQQPGAAGGGVVVPPRRSPTPLQVVPSSTPRLRGGGR